MIMITQDDLRDQILTHRCNQDQVLRMENIRQAALVFATVILDNSRPSPDQSVGIRKVREAVMTVNSGISQEKA